MARIVHICKYITNRKYLSLGTVSSLAGNTLQNRKYLSLGTVSILVTIVTTSDISSTLDLGEVSCINFSTMSCRLSTEPG